MSVLGVGLDLVEVAPFARQLDVVGSCFAESTFTDDELAIAKEAVVKAAATDQLALARHLAARFAAKEAFVKAWSMARAGQPPAMDDVEWKCIEVVSDPWGRPSLVVHGETERRVQESLGPTMSSLSLTHEDSVAAAVVVLSRTTPTVGKAGGAS